MVKFQIRRETIFPGLKTSSFSVEVSDTATLRRLLPLDSMNVE